MILYYLFVIIFLTLISIKKYSWLTVENMIHCSKATNFPTESF